MKTIFFRFFTFYCCLFFSLSVGFAQTDKLLFVEAESFDDYGGWVLDQQYMNQMGSPILMAHGIGTPVADVKTKIRFPQEGTYRIFVRTRNWVSPWTTEYAPMATWPAFGNWNFTVLDFQNLQSRRKFFDDTQNVLFQRFTQFLKRNRSNAFLR